MTDGPRVVPRALAAPDEWGLADVLRQHPGLRLRPRSADVIVLAGAVRCCADGAGGVVDEVYAVELWIPSDYPHSVPLVFETGGRIPRSFHHLASGALCLGSPTTLRLVLDEYRTIGGFIDAVVLPYLYGHACHVRSGVMPFGELEHGAAGLERDLRRVFGMPHRADVLRLLHLAGLRRRHANKYPCPCGSGVRLGRCHHLQVNALRRRVGRRWWRQQTDALLRQRTLEKRQ